MKLARGSLADPSAVVVSLALAGQVVGCSSHSTHGTTPHAARARAPEPTFESQSEMIGPAQRRAQRVWCAYLDALYRRAAKDGTAWVELERCNAETSTASPEMLERTAACSQQALDDFTGDPFTDAYAAEVKHCGTVALEALALPALEVEPFVTSACERATACGQGDAAACRSDLTSRFGDRLCLALGALNPASRIAVRRCLQTAACQSAEDALSGCLDPMLDKLLWTPG